ncbi:MAG TPA: phosphoribosylanthranilate isomerase [Solirubrobacteraceae bacterium]|jgi:phosphoribosylanthranilate isomerase
MTSAADDPLARQRATRVKICGLTNLDDAEAAEQMGAWALGMIFYEDSPRRCSPEQAARIAAALRRRTELCGVFVNAPLDEVARVGRELGLSMVQLHGDEGPAYCAEVARRTGARVIRAMQISGPGDLRASERFHVDYHLLDARSPERPQLRGGTGATFDWSLLSQRRTQVPLILSGGLDASNVAAAIAAVHPYAVDSASGTESAPGHKDREKMAALFAAVRATAEDPGGSSAAAAEQPAHPVAGQS